MPKRYESLMTTAFCYFRVRDYDFWRAGYVRAIKPTPEVQAFKIWRGEDDLNYVITAETFNSSLRQFGPVRK
jgi:hypothetical protein